MLVEPRIAGTMVISLQRYLATEHGPDAYAGVLAASPAHAGAFTGVPSAIHWYPTAAYFALLDSARVTFGPHDFFERFGAAAAEEQISTLYRWILRFTSPTWLITRGVSMWSRYHNTGAWTLEPSERAIRGVLRDFGVVHGPFCRLLCAWLQRAGQLTGAPDFKMWHPECRASGKNECVFVGKW